MINIRMNDFFFSQYIIPYIYIYFFSAHEQLRAAGIAITSARGEASGRVQDSKQFAQLKKILEKKNNELRELREKLAKYEPDSTRMVDDY